MRKPELVAELVVATVAFQKSKRSLKSMKMDFGNKRGELVLDEKEIGQTRRKKRHKIKKANQNHPVPVHLR